jgi:hypothetical protein
MIPHTDADYQFIRDEEQRLNGPTPEDTLQRLTQMHKVERDLRSVCDKAKAEGVSIQHILEALAAEYDQ